MTLTPQPPPSTPHPLRPGAAPAAPPAISTRALARSFGRTPALVDLDLDIPQGAIYALVGPNGAGKSTLIKLLLNILQPTSGAANVLGLPSTHIAGAAFTRIGYVSENQELPDWMTVPQLLRYLRPFYPHWDLALEAQLLRQFDLPSDRKLKHLSRGQRMKAALLSVLPYRPELIVLDEPFSGLDPLVRDELIEGLLDRVTPNDRATPTDRPTPTDRVTPTQPAAIQAAGRHYPPTILLSSHDLAEIENLASHVGYLDRGRLLFSEDIATLSARFREITVTLNPPPISPPHPVLPSDPEQTASRNLTTPTYPASWLLPEPGPSLFRFIHAHADTEPIHDQVAAHLPNAAAIDAQPISLRSIFLALAKSNRTVAEPLTSAAQKGSRP